MKTFFFMDGWYPNRDPKPTFAEHTTETNLLGTFYSEIVGVSSIKGYSAHPESGKGNCSRI
jgi:hypothetical protein